MTISQPTTAQAAALTGSTFPASFQPHVLPMLACRHCTTIIQLPYKVKDRMALPPNYSPKLQPAAFSAVCVRFLYRRDRNMPNTSYCVVRLM